jgi:hypothetical protein
MLATNERSLPADFERCAGNRDHVSLVASAAGEIRTLTMCIPFLPAKTRCWRTGMRPWRADRCPAGDDANAAG